MKQKWMLVITALVLLVPLAACAAQPAPQPTPAAAAGNSQQPPVRQISASGSGQVYLTPDVAYVSLGVQTQSKTVSEALKSNNVQAQAIAKVLVDAGVDAKDIQTTNFSVFPQQQFGPTGELIGTTYQVNNTVYITVRNLQSLPDLLDKAVSAGSNNVNGITFDVLDKTKALSEARKQAVANAKANAEELAGAAGVSLGDLITLNVSTQGGPVPLFEGKGGAVAGAAPSAPVSAGQLLLSVNADMTYAIK